MHKDGWVVAGYNRSERSACECCITMLVQIVTEAVEEGAVAGPEDSSVYYGGKILIDFPLSSAERSLSDHFLELSSN